MTESLVNLSSAYEARTLEALTKPFILPVTIVTGFLGSGKTTLLQSLMRKKRNLRIATLVNDFGSINYDGDLLERTTDPSRLYQLHDGCMCCSHRLTERMKDDVWEMLQTPDDGSGRAVDYLVIETSGVTEPQRIIQALDQRFGKMTRARLDSVVALVDADAVYHQHVAGPHLHTPQPLPLSMRSQLQHADVVVLNKVDLLPHDDTPHAVKAVEGLVRGVNPHARLHLASFGDVPLPLVLDVELPDAATPSTLTHEAGRADFVASGSKRLRSDASKPATTTNGPAPSSSSAAGGEEQQPHLSSDALSSLTFDSPVPFALARLQRLLALELPPGIIRIKGAVHVRESGGQRWRVSMSGRRRFSVESDGPWASAPRTQLVLIGRGLDQDSPALRSRLEQACCSATEGHDGDDRWSDMTRTVVITITGPGSPGAAPSQLSRRLCDLVRADARFELVGGGEGGVVAFRLSGARALGVSEEHLSLKHGVDVSGMNEDLRHRVNMAAGQARPGTATLLWPLMVVGQQERQAALGFAVEEEEGGVDGGMDYEAFWTGTVAAEAERVVRERMSHVRLCKCGH